MTASAILTNKGALSLGEFLVWSSLGRTKALEEIAAGRLHAVKVGRRLLSQSKRRKRGWPRSRAPSS